MSKIKLAINGFGRIGRLSARLITNKYSDQIELVAINDLVPAANLAYLFEHDSTYKKPGFEVDSNDNEIIIKKAGQVSQVVKMYSQKDPNQLPWSELGVDVVLECTGIFRDTQKASMHLNAGAKKVLISAPAKDEQTGTVVLGVNEESINQNIISNASCTTNCIAPVLKTIDDKYEILNGFGLTAHAYTASQTLQDGPVKKNLRAGRAAAVNMIPTTTGAAKAVVKVMPQLAGKLDMSALRVPVITGSMVYLTLQLKEENLTVSEINKVFGEVSQNSLKGILEYSDEELVSTDIIGNPHSTIFDSKLTEVSGNLLKVVVWYDNEWGYTNRLVEAVLKSNLK